MAQLMSLLLTVSCFGKIQIGFTFLVTAHLGSPGKVAVKCVCACVCACLRACVRVTYWDLYIGLSDVTISTAMMRSHFCGYNIS